MRFNVTSLASVAAVLLSASSSAWAMQTPGSGEVYEYDERRRLISITYEDCSSISFAYDLNGNRTSRTVTSASCAAPLAPIWSSGTTGSAPENQTGTGYTAAATDPESAAVTYSIAGGADQARFSINSTSGVLSFVTAPDFELPSDNGGNNVYDVTLRASDGSLSSDRAVAITVTDVVEQTNQAPTAVADNSSVAPANSATIFVLANDADPDGDTLTITAVSTPSKGSVSIKPTAPGTYLQYVAFPFSSGTDTFTYTISDGNGGTDTATVTVVIEAGGCTGLCE